MEEKKVPDPRKVEIRKNVDTKLLSMTDDDRQRQSDEIVKKILADPKYKSAQRISLFLSLPTEVDVSPLIQDILKRGDAVFVPQYFKGKMRMLKMEDGDYEVMPETSWGIKQHSKDAIREDALDNGGLDLVITPGAAFTRSGWRVGHGGGYYDRYLTELKRRHGKSPADFREPYILAVGFKQQMYDEVPINSNDVQVDEVISAD